MAATQKIAQLQKALDQARQKATAHVSAITRNEANLNADGIAAELEKARRADTAEIEAVRRELEAAKNEARVSLAAAAFGPPRDATERVEWRLAVNEACAKGAPFKTIGDRSVLIGDVHGIRAAALAAFGESDVQTLRALAKHDRDLADFLAFEYQHGALRDVATATAQDLRESFGTTASEQVTADGAMVATPFS